MIWKQVTNYLQKKQTYQRLSDSKYGSRELDQPALPDLDVTESNQQILHVIVDSIIARSMLFYESNQRDGNKTYASYTIDYHV